MAAAVTTPADSVIKCQLARMTADPFGSRGVSSIL
jgi:hypothetical protein